MSSLVAQQLLGRARCCIETTQSYDKNQLDLSQLFLSSLRLTWIMSRPADTVGPAAGTARPQVRPLLSQQGEAELGKGRRDGMFVIDKIDDLAAPVGPQVDASLRALGIETVDLFAFHAVSKMSDWERISTVGMAELARCQATGKVRFRGISSHHPDVLRAALDSALCDVVMFPVGPFVNDRYRSEILPLARRNGVGTICFKTFGAGKLLGDTTGYNQPLQARPRGKFSSGGQEPSTEPQLPRLSVAECLHYTLTLDPDVALLGMSFPNEQDAVFRAFEAFRPLEQEKMKAIEMRAAEAIEGKGDCWWNPPENGGPVPASPVAT